MKFIKSYKRLDNLCKDLLRSETGVTTYISSMEHIRCTRFQTYILESDYKKLKHYRYIRNQIVHENYADETNMCDENDTLWIEQFYQRILDRTDPLSIYQKAVTSSQQSIKSKKTDEFARSQVVNKQTSNKSKFLITIILVIIALISVSAILLLLWN